MTQTPPGLQVSLTLQNESLNLSFREFSKTAPELEIQKMAFLVPELESSETCHIHPLNLQVHKSVQVQPLDRTETTNLDDFLRVLTV